MSLLAKARSEILGRLEIVQAAADAGYEALHPSKETNNRAVLIHGVPFPSITAAAAAVGESVGTVGARIRSKSEQFKDWIYAPTEVG